MGHVKREREKHHLMAITYACTFIRYTRVHRSGPLCFLLWPFTHELVSCGAGDERNGGESETIEREQYSSAHCSVFNFATANSSVSQLLMQDAMVRMKEQIRSGALNKLAFAASCFCALLVYPFVFPFHDRERERERERERTREWPVTRGAL